MKNTLLKIVSGLKPGLWLLCLILLNGVAGAQLRILGSTPPQGSISAHPIEPIRIRFDRALDTLSITPASLVVSGNYFGRYPYQTRFVDSTNTLEIRPRPAFVIGESITILLTTAVRGFGGSPLPTPYRLAFRTRNTQGDILGFPPTQIFEFDLGPGDQQPADLAVGDFDHDFFSDAAVVNSTSNTLSIMKNLVRVSGAPAFVHLQSYPTGTTPVAVETADLDGDVRLDLVVVNFNDNTIRIFWGTGLATFESPQTIPVGSRPSGAAIEDFNGDGWPDIAVSLFGDDAVVILENQGGRSFITGPVLACQKSTFGVAAADFDGDGDPDLAAINNGDQSVSIFENRDFAGWNSFAVLPLGQRPTALKWANIRGSRGQEPGYAVQELLVMSSDLTLIGKQGDAPLAPASRLSVFRYDSLTVQFALARELILEGVMQSFEIANYDYSLPTAVLPNDRDLDLIMGDYTGGTLQYIPNIDNLGLADTLITIDSTFSPRAMARGDFDRDGDSDLLFTNHLENKLGLMIIPPFDFDIQFPDTLIDFGDVYVGDTSEVVYVYRPDGAIDLQVEAQLEDQTHFAVQPDSFTVQAGSSQPITFSFLPRDTLQYFTRALFTFSHPLQEDPVTVLMEGRGVKVIINTNPLALDFGLVPTGFQRTLELIIRNEGNGVLQISGFSNSLSQFVYQVTPMEVGPYDSTAVLITFIPDGAGFYSDTLLIASNDRENPLFPVILLGRSSFDPPVITSPDTVTAVEDQYFLYRATAVDPEDEPVSFRFSDRPLPSWLSAAADTVFGTPREGDRDTTFRVIASDGFLEDTLDVYVMVIPVNDAPVFEDPGPQTITEGENLSLLIRAVDPEQERLRLGAAGLPAGAAFRDNGDNTALFDWTPLFGQAGNYTVSFSAVETVSNPALSASLDLPITVLKKAPDLVAVDLTVSRSPIFLSQTALITAVVENRDAPVSSPFRIRISIDSRSVFDTTVTAMAIGERFTLRAPGQFNRLGETPVDLNVDTQNSISEVSETNNHLHILVAVLPGKLAVRPNPFTPNRDGRNDQAVFDLSELGINRPMLEIFDFAGRRIRSLSRVSNSRIVWDGLDQSGRELLPGVYLYVLQDGNKLTARGYVVLAR